MGNKNSGRRAKSVTIAGVQQTLDASASEAAKILDNRINRRQGFKSLPMDLQRACEYVIDHAIGKARQKIEHSGGVLTYSALVRSAEELDTKPRDILADVEEIANKYQDKTPGNTEPGPKKE